MGGNRAGTIRKQRIKRIKREAARLLARHQSECCAAHKCGAAKAEAPKG